MDGLWNGVEHWVTYLIVCCLSLKCFLLVLLHSGRAIGIFAVIGRVSLSEIPWQLARESALSFPAIPTWLGTHSIIFFFFWIVQHFLYCVNKIMFGMSWF